MRDAPVDTAYRGRRLPESILRREHWLCRARRVPALARGRWQPVLTGLLSHSASRLLAAFRENTKVMMPVSGGVFLSVQELHGQWVHEDTSR